MKTQNKLMQKRLLERILNSLAIPDRFDNVAGSFDNCKYVLIGEAPANESPLKRCYPFRDIIGCSGWLNSLLDKEEILESDLFWINAHHLDGTPNDIKILDYLQNKKIICLGKKAEKWLKPTGLKYESVPHPQYWRRFKSKEKYPLIDLLKE
jgi:hypothetical protein